VTPRGPSPAPGHHVPVRASQTDRVELPDELDPRRLARRAIPVLIGLGVIGAVVALAPGLGDVRDTLARADPAWIALAVVFEALSCLSYVLMFRPIFCPRMPWRTSTEIALSELAVGSIVPASGAGGLALGAWVLHEGGMPAEQIARRSVAFFLVKSSVNFVAVAVVGVLMAVGVLGPHQSPWLTVAPAAGAALVIALVVLIPRLGPGQPPPPDAGTWRRLLMHGRQALVTGTAEAIRVIRSGNLLVIAGSIGYWAWDNAVLWAAFHAFGAAPPISVILMGYLIGQLGGLLPIPGGVGGIDGGLFGTLVLYGAPAAAAAAAVLGYRVVLFWLPLIVGSVAFVSLRRGLNDPSRPDLCDVPSVQELPVVTVPVR
jgi:uncharacterized membrane protein YbhN (UPF0104 family)